LSWYDVHGRTIRIEGGHAAIDERLGWAEAAACDADVEIDYVAESLPAGAGRTVYESRLGTARYDERDDCLTFTGTGLSLRCLGAAGRAKLWVDPERQDAGWLASRPLLTLALTETLKYRGLYPLHAGAVSAGGRAILVTGPTKAGKSTLTIALARAGCAFMADDLVFLEETRVLGFPERADLDAGASFFPELTMDAIPPAARSKVAVDVPFATAASAMPGLIVFPRVAGGERSTLTRISAEAALLRLGPDVLLTAPRTSQAHLDAIADVIEASACYELATGTSVTEAAELVLDAAGPIRRADADGRFLA
jgi:hypothetical protein